MVDPVIGICLLFYSSSSYKQKKRIGTRLKAVWHSEMDIVKWRQGYAFI